MPAAPFVGAVTIAAAGRVLFVDGKGDEVDPVFGELGSPVGIFAVEAVVPVLGPPPHPQ